MSKVQLAGARSGAGLELIHQKAQPAINQRKRIGRGSGQRGFLADAGLAFYGFE